MTPWEDAAEIIQRVKSGERTPELFERCAKNTLVSPCIFNQIRKELSPSDYEEFDLLYCGRGSPEALKQIEETRKLRKAEEWQKSRTELLEKKKQLLMKKSQLLMQKSQLQMQN